jgi:hypothetical protein
MMALGIIASVGQAVAGYAQANQQAKEQNAYAESNRRAAVAANNDKYASLQNNTLQHREAAAQEKFQKQIEAMRAKATAATAAGEGGVTGISVDNLEQDLAAQHGRQVQAIETNYEIKNMGNYDEAVASYHNAIGRINSVRAAAKPSPLGFIFQALGGIAGGMK